MRPAPLAIAALSFAAAVASQVLTYASLPLADAVLAPEPWLAALPLLALLAGTTISTFPVALLSDGFGRRAAAATGASLGLAGGILASFAIVSGQFPLLVLGSLWLGISQGFGLAQRHQALGYGDAAPRRAAVIFAAGTLAALAAPLATGVAEAALAPYAYAGTIAAAAACHLLALGLSVLSGPVDEPDAEPGGAASAHAGDVLRLALAGAVSWFAMGSVMAGAPGALVGCGLGYGAVAGLVSWHVVAMYAPAFAAPVLLARIEARRALWIGAALAAGATLLGRVAPDDAALVTAGYWIAGAAWSLANVSGMAALAALNPSRRMIALHDALLFAAAGAGLLVG
jgi:hypothetical protein